MEYKRICPICNGEFTTTSKNKKLCHSRLCLRARRSISLIDRKNLKEAVVQEYTTRLCLKCEKEFKSSGAGNRLCVECAHSNTRVSVVLPVPIAF